ncbi:MAG: protein kinase, partial [Planctomycetota bacterium]|nr:protein kinase [Planctomycetota bacterium]
MSESDRIEELFHEALALDAVPRREFLDRIEREEPRVGAMLRKLIEAHEAAERSMPTPPIEGATDASMALPDDLLLGETLNGFTVERVLGMGGMGTVYFAMQQSPRRHVALKVLHAGGLSREATYRFTLEAQVLASLDHPSIAHVYEAGFASVRGTRVPFLAMELVAGCTLHDHAHTTQASLEQRLSLFTQICGAVEHAHRKGVIHRDIKPGNIMVGACDVPKILDFGVARLISPNEQSAAGRTQAGQIIGTLQYMSPEQVAGDPLQIDTRTDVYALGVILFELLAGELPYDVRSTSVAQAALIIKDHTPRALGLLRPQYRGDLETIVAKAMEKEPARRYQSAADLAADIGRYLRHEPILARPASRTYLVRKFVRRNRAITALSAVVLLSLVGGIAGVTMAMRRAMAAKVDADIARAAESTALATSKGHEQRAVKHAAEAEFASYVASIAAASAAVDSFDVRAARRFLEQCPEHLRQWEWRYLQQRLNDDLSEQMFPPKATAPGGQVWSLRTSEDGKWVAASNASTVMIWNPLTGERRDLTIEQPGKAWSLDHVHGVSLSADGALLACAHAWQRVATVWDLRTGKLLQEFTGHTDEVEDVGISPDGTRLITGSYDSTVCIWDVATGKRLRVLHGHSGRVQNVSFSRDATRALSCSSDGTMRVWDVETGEQISMVSLLHSVHMRGAFSPTGQEVAVIGGGAAPVVAATADGRILRRLDAESRGYTSVAWSPDGRVIALGADDRVLRLFDAASGAAGAKLRGHEHSVSNIAFLPGRDLILTAGISDVSGVKVWSTLAPIWPRTIAAHPGDIEPLRFTPDSRRLISIGSRWQTTLVHDVESGAVVSVLRSPIEHLELGAVDAAGEVEVVNSRREVERWGTHAGDGPLPESKPQEPSLRAKMLIQLFDSPVRAQLRQKNPGHWAFKDGWRWEVLSISGAYAARSHPQQGMEVVETAQGHVVAAFPQSTPGGKIAVGNARDVFLIPLGDDVGVVECAGENVVQWLLPNAATGMLCAATSPDGQRVAIGYTTGEVRLFDVASHQLVYSMKAGARWVEC